MTNDEIDALHNTYRRARKVFCELDLKRDELGQKLAQIGETLSPISTNHPFTPKSPLSERQVESILTLPSPQEIADLLEKWTSARSSMLSSWKKLPPEEQEHCKPLPDDVSHL